MPWLSRFANGRCFLCLCLVLSGRTVAEHRLTVQGQAIQATRPYREHLGFAFAAGGCELGIDYCTARAPRSWEAREIEVVHAALDEISASTLGRAIMARAQASGFRVLQRFGQFAVRHADGQVEARPTVSANAHSSASGVNTIDFNDLFFRYAGATDGFSGTPGYALPTAILLHEMVHGMDQGTYSGSAEFYRLIGFTRAAGDGSLVLATRSTAEESEWARFREEKIRLLTDGQHEAAWKVDRTYAVTILKGRLPTMIAVQNPEEAFAEIGAHLVLDPNARTQIESGVIDYFNDAVSGRLQ